MNDGCRLHAWGTPEKIFKFVFTPPVRPVPTLVASSALASWLPRLRACDIRLHGKWTYKYISYVNSDEIYPTALPILPVVPHFIYSRSSLRSLTRSFIISLFNPTNYRSYFLFPFFVLYSCIWLSLLYNISHNIQLFWYTSICSFDNIIIQKVLNFLFSRPTSCVILQRGYLSLFTAALPILLPFPLSPSFEIICAQVSFPECTLYIRRFEMHGHRVLRESHESERCNFGCRFNSTLRTTNESFADYERVHDGNDMRIQTRMSAASGVNIMRIASKRALLEIRKSGFSRCTPQTTVPQNVVWAIFR